MNHAKIIKAIGLSQYAMIGRAKPPLKTFEPSASRITPRGGAAISAKVSFNSVRTWGVKGLPHL